MAESKTVKSRNLAWLVSMAAMDVAIVALVAFPFRGLASIDAAMAVKAAVAPFLPIVVLVLSHLIPADVKAALVYWKISDAQPASDAFTKHIREDARIDADTLRKKLGTFPVEGREQNAVWYRLYRQAQDEPAVLDGLKSYLLFRDMAVVSLLLLPSVPLALVLAGGSWRLVLTTVVLFAWQYVLTVFPARIAGVRLVKTVLAVHGAGYEPRREK